MVAARGFGCCFSAAPAAVIATIEGRGRLAEKLSGTGINRTLGGSVASHGDRQVCPAADAGSVFQGAFLFHLPQYPSL